MKRFAIIVAGGSGIRMGTLIPKQFLELDGIPVLMHSIKHFHEAYDDINIIVVLPQSEKRNWQKLVEIFSFTVPHKIVSGGSSRSASVANGLIHVPDDCIVAVHDGVRPLVSTSLIRECFDAALQNTNAVPAIPVVDSLRINDGDNTKIVDRELFRIVQTPQCFDAGLLRAAYKTANDESFSDDATVFENAGHKINVIEGEKTNIKITVVQDLLIAESILKSIRN